MARTSSQKRQVSARLSGPKSAKKGSYTSSCSVLKKCSVALSCGTERSATYDSHSVAAHALERSALIPRRLIAAAAVCCRHSVLPGSPLAPRQPTR